MVQTDEVCDATEDDNTTKADYIITNIILYEQFNYKQFP